MEDSVYCYNKGCGKQFKLSENKEDSCRYHSGGPIFHDALKGWSCCKKRSTDFTEFLNIPGCTHGFHSNVKPDLPTSATAKRTNEETNNADEATLGKTSELLIKPVQIPMERPSIDEPKIALELNAIDTLKAVLEKQMNQLQLDKGELINGEGENVILKGTSCKNNGCTVTYLDESSNGEMCIYHSGIPVFHEGMKYWSCCEQKTSDFNAFLNQSGCCHGKHIWIKKEDKSKKVACRSDWHQTATHVTITIFSKLSNPGKSKISANKVSCDVRICFDGDKNIFEKSYILKGIIDPTKSEVKMLTSKIEINMKKLEPGSWSSLELK